MGNFKKVKSLQLATMLILLGGVLLVLFKNKELFHLVANQLEVGKLFFLVWLLLVACFGFLIYDFTVYIKLKRTYGEIDMAMYSDPMTGIGNRSSLDAFIDEYASRDLPEGIGSITFCLTHMGDINKKYGNKEGDMVIKEFSNILADCGKGRCFVGRNGGNQFLALFKESAESDLLEFVNEVKEKTLEFNEKNEEGKSPIIFKFGEATHTNDDQLTMNELVASSYKKAMAKEEDDCGLWKD